jgi:hypothetical protein
MSFPTPTRTGAPSPTAQKAVFRTVLRVLLGGAAVCGFPFGSLGGPLGSPDGAEAAPRLVNIINFVRLCEPRDDRITEEVLYQTVVRQVEAMRRHALGGTFLLQYDALLDERYQTLMKGLPTDTFEIGAWWEIPQPLVEAAGLTWRGRFPWDWHADVGFSTGYTPRERELLVDVYMSEFKRIFGDYPKSVGSWFIDAHTLNYLSEKYAIVASCNCKDQVGTDGYTVWGGYWNQAYYPSKLNCYMPAQHAQNQIPVPIFRMLGSDPIRQYDHGLGRSRQGVVSLEPVYREAGGNPAWVNWYFRTFVEGEPLAFAYVQAGQENSFTWEGMARGYEIQMPLIARLRNEGKVRVETLAASGQWFRRQFPTTPATAVTALHTLPDDDRQTVWFNSRFYRVNLLWEHHALRIRDIHVFDESLASDYLTERATSNECSFFALPLVDGYRWSTPETLAGMRLRAVIDGREQPVQGGDPAVSRLHPGALRITWPISSFPGTLVIDMDETRLQMTLEAAEPIDWFLDLTTAAQAALPYTTITPHRVDCRFRSARYALTVAPGFATTPGNGTPLRITPEQDSLAMQFTTAANTP